MKLKKLKVGSLVPLHVQNNDAEVVASKPSKDASWVPFVLTRVGKATCDLMCQDSPDVRANGLPTDKVVALYNAQQRLAA